MKTNIEHSIRVVTEIWHQLEKSRTKNNDGATSQSQKMLLQAAFEKYDIVDIGGFENSDRRGIRVPVLRCVAEILEDVDK